VAWLVLDSRLSARMRDLAERMTRRGPLRTMIYWAQYLAVTTVATLPLTAYRTYFRERQYGFGTQTLVPWLADQGKVLLLNLLLWGPFLAVLYGVLRRRPRTWWAWGAGLTSAFVALVTLAGPAYITPLFYRQTPLADAALRQPLLSLARAHGLPAREVYVMDVSRRTTRISAGVLRSGGGRIVLSDTLVERASPPEIRALVAREVGHQVLHHTHRLALEFAILIVLGFGFLGWSVDWVLRRRAERWGARGVGDTAVWPLLAALLAVFFFVVTPVSNTLVRVNEVEADIFGLNAAREPEGFAEAALKLGESSRMAPGRLEEMLFFDRPSARSRILMAMRWKAEQRRIGGGASTRPP
jgi:STE24 endopeptidase